MAATASGTRTFALGVAALSMTGVIVGAVSAPGTGHQQTTTPVVAAQDGYSGQAAPAAAANAPAAPANQPAAQAKQSAWRAVKPVAGLNQAQMKNAQRIVNQGRAMGMSERAMVLAVACAMQESQLTNLASTVLPESYNYWNEGEGSDHDSIGLFQQRPSSGWGSVKNIMWPAYSSKQFYQALQRVPGWQKMPLTYAIQSVQVSAFPEAYAKHEGKATAVVEALL